MNPTTYERAKSTIAVFLLLITAVLAFLSLSGCSTLELDFKGEHGAVSVSTDGDHFSLGYRK